MSGILVTGANGKTGSEAVRRLRAAGARVRAMVRSAAKGEALRATGAEVVVADLTTPATIGPALEGMDHVLLVTSPSPDQVAVQHNLIEAAMRGPRRHVVKVSAVGTGPRSPFALGRWHAEIEAELVASGMGWTFLRPQSYMQNLLMAAPTIQTEGKLYAPMRDGRTPLVDVRDVAAVAAACVLEPGHEGMTYDVTGGEAVSYAEVAAHIGRAIGKPVTYVDVPPAAARAGMLQAGLPDWLADDLLVLYGIAAAGKSRGPTTVVRDVGGKDPVTIAEFARDHAAAFRGG
ncbi:MAG: SDR family oxidoreductase [Gemmatimonadota bacterium]|nr:SDR family oxidoreductase [Gemmatimonadota bacterium]